MRIRAFVVVVALALASAVAVVPGEAAAGDRPGPDITFVDISPVGFRAPMLSERGHVALVQGYSGAPDIGVRGYVWFRGVLAELAPDIAPEVASAPSAVNDRGQVAGGTFGWEVGARSFVWEDGTLTWLTEPDPSSTDFPSDIDRRGRVLLNRSGRASVLDGGREIVSPYVLGSVPLNGQAMNDRGDVIGNVSDYLGPVYLWPVGSEPIRIEAPGWAFVWEVNNSGAVLGRSLVDGHFRTWLWRRGRITDLGTLGGDDLPGENPTKDQLNERGQVTGTSETATGELHAFRWSNGRMRDLGTLGGPNSYGSGINDHGDVVGTSDTATGETHAFLWRNGTMTDLGALTGSPQSSATAINDRGQVVGSRGGPTGYYWVLWETGRR